LRRYITAAGRKVPKFHVLLTTYKYADDPALRGVPWDSLMVDEGHSLKGGASTVGRCRLNPSNTC